MRFLYLMLFLVLLTASSACENPNAVVDVQLPIPEGNWAYTKKISIPVKVEDNRSAYNVSINLRHTSDYKYSNIYIRIKQVDPAKKAKVFRKEFTLAKPDGEWVGIGSGKLYVCQLPVYQNYRFPQKGTYIFELEQNMRDNPLRDISDVGLRVEKVD